MLCDFGSPFQCISSTLRERGRWGLGGRRFEEERGKDCRERERERVRNQEIPSGVGMFPFQHRNRYTCSESVCCLADMTKHLTGKCFSSQSVFNGSQWGLYSLAAGYPTPFHPQPPAKTRDQSIGPQGKPDQSTPNANLPPIWKVLTNVYADLKVTTGFPRQRGNSSSQTGNHLIGQSTIYVAKAIITA